MKRLIAFSLLLSALIGGAQAAEEKATVEKAAVEITELSPEIAFEVDGKSFSYQAVNLLLAQSKKHDSEVDEQQLLKGLIENHLFYTHLNQEDHEDHDHEFSTAVQGFTEYTQLLNQILPNTEKLDSAGFKVIDIDIEPEKLAAILLPKNGQRMVSEDISHDQETQLQRYEVARYQVNNKIAKVFFWDIYSVANVHDRTRMRRADPVKLKQKSKQFVDVKRHEYLIAVNTPWTDQALKDLNQFVADKVNKQAYLKEMGVIADLHHDAPGLDKFKKNVTQQQVTEYYEKNKGEFVQVASVKARHITVASQAEADRVYQEIKQGLSFSDAIKRYSIATDKNAKEPGSLGLIAKDSKTLKFYEKLALIQPAGKVSTPYRMLDGKSYEILFVDEKTPAFLPVDDKSVINEIKNKLARQAAATHIESEKHELIKTHRILINKQYYNNLVW